jgi:hypothetical protein
VGKKEKGAVSTPDPLHSPNMTGQACYQRLMTEQSRRFCTICKFIIFIMIALAKVDKYHASSLNVDESSPF